MLVFLRGGVVVVVSGDGRGGGVLFCLFVCLTQALTVSLADLELTHTQRMKSFELSLWVANKKLKLANHHCHINNVVEEL